MNRALDLVSWPARTARLTLRPAVADDDVSTWGFRQLEPVCRWLTHASSTFEDYQGRFRDPARLATTVVIELEGEVIGDLMLKVEDGWAQAEVADQARGVQAELGWALDPAHAGHGYATEAVEELLRLCSTPCACAG